MTKAIIIESNGNCEVQELVGYDDINKAVGGWIESVFMGGQATAFVNEEGKLLDLPFNRKATTLWSEMNPVILLNDFIVGNMVVFGPLDEEGFVTDVSETLVKKFTK